MISNKLILGLPLVFTTMLAGCQAIVMPTVKPVSNATIEKTANQTLIIMYDSNFDKTAFSQLLQRYQGVITYEYPSLNGMAIRLPNGANINQAIADIRAIKGVTSVEQDSIQTAQ